MDINWAYVIPFLSGGVMAALLNILYARYQSKKQKIIYNMSISPIFDNKGFDKTYSSSLSINAPDGHLVKSVNNLTLVIFNITNTSNKDYGVFDLAISMKGAQRIIKMDVQSPDRKHEIKTLVGAYFSAPSNYVDIELNPFNKKDNYVVKLFIEDDAPANRDTKFSEKETEVSTKQPVKILFKEDGDVPLRVSADFYVPLISTFIVLAISFFMAKDVLLPDQKTKVRLQEFFNIPIREIEREHFIDSLMNKPKLDSLSNLPKK